MRAYRVLAHPPRADVGKPARFDPKRLGGALGRAAEQSSRRPVKSPGLSTRSERNDFAHLYNINAHLTALAAHA